MNEALFNAFSLAEAEGFPVLRAQPTVIVCFDFNF